MKNKIALMLISLILLSGQALAFNDAEFVSQSVPNQMIAGQEYQVRVSMRNTGDTVWGEDHRLGSENPMDNTTWTGFTRVFLDDGETVNPGETKDFIFTVTAPSSPGPYNFRWGMVQDGVEWFGQLSDNLQINITSGGAASEKPLVFIQYHIAYGIGECPYGWWDWWHWPGTEDDPCQTRFDSPWLRQISSAYYPLIGPYSSQDPEVIRWHMKLAKASGIDGFLVSVFYNEPDFYPIFEIMLSVAEEEDFKIGIEGWMPEEGDEATYMQKVRQQIDSYSSSNAYLKINGKPVYMFNFYAQWLTNSELINFLNSRVAYWIVETDMNTASINLSGSEIHSANTTYSGFDERMISVEPGRDYRSSPRNLGQVLEDSLYVLENNGADVIVVFSWNDFNEGSQIEPGHDIEEHLGPDFLPHQEVIYDGDPYRYLKVIADFKGVEWITPEIPCQIVDDLLLTSNVVSCGNETPAEEPPAEEPPVFECEDGETSPCFISQFRLGITTCVDGFWGECERQRRYWWWKR